MWYIGSTELKELHCMPNMGVDRTLHLIWKVAKERRLKAVFDARRLILAPVSTTPFSLVKLELDKVGHQHNTLLWRDILNNDWLWTWMTYSMESIRIPPNRLEKWNIRRYFRAVYKPGGNGIVDWKHQTKKAIAAKRGISPVEAIF